MDVTSWGHAGEELGLDAGRRAGGPSLSCNTALGGSSRLDSEDHPQAAAPAIAPAVGSPRSALKLVRLDNLGRQAMTLGNADVSCTSPIPLGRAPS